MYKNIVLVNKKPCICCYTKLKEEKLSIALCQFRKFHKQVKYFLIINVAVIF